MQNTYILKGKLINHDTIKLNKPVPIEDGYVKVTIEQETVVEKKKKSRKKLYGAWKGKIEMSPDFDKPLDCFKDYM